MCNIKCMLCKIKERNLNYSKKPYTYIRATWVQSIYICMYIRLVDFLVSKNWTKINKISSHSPLYPLVTRQDQTDASAFHAILLPYNIKQRASRYCEDGKALSVIASHLPLPLWNIDRARNINANAGGGVARVKRRDAPSAATSHYFCQLLRARFA